MYTSQSVTNCCAKVRMKHLGRAYIRLCSSPSFESLNFEERMITMLDFVAENQLIQKVERLKRQAKLPYPCVEVSDFDLKQQPSIKRSQVEHLLSLNWVAKGQHLVIHGPNGNDKVKFGCGFANHAMEQSHPTEHFEFNQLIFELRLAQKNNELTELFKRLSKLDLLMLSNWHLGELELVDMYLLFSLLETVLPSLSLLITSDSPVQEWASSLDEPLLSNRLTELVCDNVRELKFKEVTNITHH
jgi:DNA replication protein DnaC